IWRLTDQKTRNKQLFKEIEVVIVLKVPNSHACEPQLICAQICWDFTGRIRVQQTQKAKKTLRIKRMETKLAKKKEEIRGMAQSLEAMRHEAEESRAMYMVLETRKNKLKAELINRIDHFVRLKASEMLLMLELGFL
ncbi:ATR-interacting protein, partial [Corchorus capsularis]